MIVTRGYGRPAGITVEGGTTVSYGFGRFLQSFVTTLRMRIRTVEYDATRTSVVEGVEV